MNKTIKVPPLPLTEEERLEIGNAREVLQRYGQYVDVADISDLAFERRNCRMKAMDLAVATRPPHGEEPTQWTIMAAQAFYEYIWDGTVL